MLSSMFRPRMEEMTERRRKLHSEDLDPNKCKSGGREGTHTGLKAANRMGM
jgi:hypothetical protein